MIRFYAFDMWVRIAILIAIGGVDVRTVQMTLDEGLVAAVDKAAKRLGMTRSAFARLALRGALGAVRIQELERKHRGGYSRKPARREEFSIWEREQVWVE
jgi:hypothetical protein